MRIKNKIIKKDFRKNRQITRQRNNLDRVIKVPKLEIKIELK